MTRIKAFSIHFFISILLIGIFLSFAYYIWYGHIYIDISGVMAPTKLLIGIDVILGPLLTLLVFKPGKKYLKLDLMLIALLQLVAFSYGAYTLYLGKPALVVLNDDFFEVIIQEDISTELSEEVKNKLGVMSSPQYVAVNPNKVIKMQSTQMQQAFFIPIELNESWVETKQANFEVVMRQLNVSPTELEFILADHYSSERTYYLIRDTFLNAVLVVKDNVAVEIVHTIK